MTNISADNNKNKVVTRFPPSPTGSLHIGGARTALFNWLYAKKHKGRMVLRFEDTDVERSDSEFADEIKNSLEWLELDYDGPYVQSERTDIYKSYLQKLLNSGNAYVSDESDNEGDRDEVIRFKNPNTTIKFTDVIRGEIVVETKDLGDFIIAKSIDEPLYHLAVVVDDHEMGVTHVIRGDEHISNTPRQLLLLEALGATRPTYAHIPLILGEDKKKLSKRHGATSLLKFKQAGVLPTGIINYLALLGWHPADEQEIFTREELIETFSLERVQKSPAIFSREKLRWVNRQHVKNLEEEEFMDYVQEFLPADINTLPEYNLDRLRRSLPIIRERTEIFSDVTKLAESGGLEYLFESPQYSSEDLLWKDDKSADTSKYLNTIKEKLSSISEDNFTAETVKDAIWEYAGKIGRGSVLWPLRFALSGRDQSPGPFALAESLGKKSTIQRIEFAIKKLTPDDHAD